MFLKSLVIKSGAGAIIRDIRFHSGLNLIVDETPVVSGRETGNNVGKTTVLKLIDYCLGGSSKEIYSDYENRRNEYKLVKDYLFENAVLVQLTLTEDPACAASREIVIERNFLLKQKKIQRIDGQDLKDDEFEKALTDILFPGHFGQKPTFRQIVAHNIRYKDLSINNTLKTLDRYTRDDEYETLYLFLLGCDFAQGDVKQELRSKINIEETFKRRLESSQTRAAYESSLALLNGDIEELERKKSALNINPDFEKDLDNLNAIKFQINLSTFEINRLELRCKILLEAQKEIEAGKSNPDLQQLQQIYRQATTLVDGIQKTFAELCEFHNRMIDAKMRFITRDLPELEADLASQQRYLGSLRQQEAELSERIIQTDSFAALEELIVKLNAMYQRKGELENTLKQLRDTESKLAELGHALEKIDSELFSDVFSQKIKEQVNKFNRHFAAVSHELYGEQYALKADTKINRRGQKLYEFTAFNTNFSSGKKQGEISCFDIAYTLFADEEGIPCMHFLLNDKKELMHDNQLVNIANFVNSKKIQFVASILKDKLPAQLNKEEYIILKLSQQTKLFKIEQLKD